MIRTRMDGSQVPQTLRGLMPKETLDDGTELPDTVLLEDDGGLEDEAQWPLMEGESLTEAPTAEQSAVDADLTRFMEDAATEIPNLPAEALQRELEREGVQAVDDVPPNRRSQFLQSIKKINKLAEKQAQEQQKQAEKQATDEQRGQEKQAAEQQKQVAQQQKDEESRVAQEQQDADELLVLEQEVTDLKESYTEIDDETRNLIEGDVRRKMQIEEGLVDGLQLPGVIPKDRRGTYLKMLKMGLNSAAQKKAKPQDSNIEMIHAPSGKKYEVEYRIVEGETVQPSHVLKGTELESTNPRYTSALQPRDLLHVDERKKINKGSENLDPPLLGRSITPDSGAPIAGEDLQVESGNGRLLMIMRAYMLGKADHYKKYLAEMGFDTSGFKQPVLMRVRTTSLSKEKRLAAVRDFSTPIAAEMGTADRAMMDAGQLKGGIFASYKGGDLKSDANREFVRNFIQAAIPANERKSFTTDTGQIDSSGLARIEGAVIAHAYGSKDMVNFLKAEADPVRKSIRNVLTQIAPSWSQMREHIKGIDPKVDITQNLTDAVTLIHRSIETGTTLKDLFDQQMLLGSDSLTSGERGKQNRQVLKWFYKSDPFIFVRSGKKKHKVQPKIASQADMLKRLSAWVSEVSTYTPGQGTMFGPPQENPLKTLATAKVEEGKSLEEELAEKAEEEKSLEEGLAEEKESPKPQPKPVFGQTGKKSAVPPAAPTPEKTSALPRELRSAKPQYGYREGRYVPGFSSETDLAMYITAQDKKSKRDSQYRSFLKGQGYSDSEIASHGSRVRETIKEQARKLYNSDTLKGPIEVPRTSPVPAESESTRVPGQPLPSKRLSRRNKKAATPEENLNTVMHRIAATVVPKGVLVNLQERRSLGSEHGSEVSGAYSRVSMPWVADRFPGGVIDVAMRSLDPEATLHHEAVHALRQLGLFTNSEWKVLSDRVEQSGMFDQIRKSYPDLFTKKGKPKAEATEEAVAWTYEEWVEGRANSTPAAVKHLWSRVKRYLRRLGAAIKGSNLQPTVEDIFGRVHSGEVGQRFTPGEVAGPRKPIVLQRREKPAVQREEFQLLDSKTQVQFEKNMRGVEPEKMGEQIRTWSKDLFQSFVREHKDLPVTAGNSQLHEMLRQLKSSPGIAADNVVRHLDKLFKDLDLNGRKTLNLKVFMDDLAEEVKSGHDIPLFDSPAHFASEYKRLNAHLKKPENADILRRVRRRRAHNVAVAKKMVESELIPKESLERINYISHRVMEYEVADRQFGSPTGKLRTPKWAKRKGSTLEINMNLAQVEAKWLARAMVDIETVKALDKIKKSKYNKRDHVKTQVRGHNKAARDQAVVDEIRENLGGSNPSGRTTYEGIVKWVYDTEDKTKNVLEKETIKDLPFFGALDSYRKAIRRNSNDLAELLTQIDPDVPQQFVDAVEQIKHSHEDAMVDGHESAPLKDVSIWPLVSWMAEGNLNAESPQLAQLSRSLFQTLTERRQLIKQTVGDTWIGMQNMASAIKKLTRAGDETVDGLAAWQPDEGNLLFTATTISEKSATKLLERAESLLKDDPQSAEVIDAETLAEVVKSIQAQTVMGGAKYQMVLDQGVADTLNSFRDNHLENMVSGLVEQSVRVWKINTLLTPAKVLKYSIRNVSGDLDHVIAAMGIKGLNPGEIKGATKELWSVMFRGADPSPLYKKAQQGAVLEGGFVLNEVQDKQRELDGYMTSTERKSQPFRKAWRLIAKSNTMRENILRYSTFRIMHKHIEAERKAYKAEHKKDLAATPDSIDKVMLSFGGYGAVPRQYLRNLDNWDDVKALYARSTLGDYGAISVAGNQLRKKLIPFFAWKEINTTWYGRASANAWWQMKVEKKVSPAVAAQLARTGASMGVKAAAYLYSRMLMWTAITVAYNHLVWPDEEEELSDNDRKKLHLIIGRWGGEIKMLPTPGALADVLAWVGFEDVWAAMNHVARGRGSVGDVMEAVGGGLVNTIVQGLTPALKLPAELLTGESWFPDVFNRRQIKDRWHHVQRALSLDKYIELAGALMNSGRPSQGPFHLVEGTLFDQRAVGYGSYSKIRSLAYQWKGHVEGESGFRGVMTERSRNYYWYKLALRRDNKPAADRYWAKLRELRVTLTQRRDMLERARPLGMLSQKQSISFRRTMDPQEKRLLMKAEKYWKDVYRGN